MDVFLQKDNGAHRVYQLFLLPVLLLQAHLRYSLRGHAGAEALVYLLYRHRGEHVLELRDELIYSGVASVAELSKLRG